MKAQAQFLQAGDWLPNTKQTVVEVYHRGLGIPAGKVEIVLRRANGTTRSARWGKYTEITYERPEA